MVIEFLGGWALALGKQKVGEALLKGIDQRLNPSELERYLAKAINAAEKEVPKLFASYEADGLKGFQRFLGRFFKGRASVQLQKPLQEKGKPDRALLAKALVKDAEEHSELQAIDPDFAEDWMQVFVARYFSETNNAIQFQLIRADYCEQILRVFDDVKFAGIAVEGQDIDRAERLAEIFVMPDLLEEERRVQEISETAEPAFLGRGKAGEPTAQRNRQQQLLLEQTQEVIRLKERKGGRKLSASELFYQGNAQHAVLLGAPGSGKTTLMNYFAVVAASEGKAIDTNDAATAKSIAALSECLPVIIRIRDLARHPDLSVLEFVRYFVEKDLAVTRDLSGFFEHYLETGKVLILLDGLDEVADLTQRYKVVDKIEAFLNQCGECRTIITSRPAGYKRDFFRMDEFPHYELQPFNDEKIDTFIEYWYNSRFELESERERRKSSLRKALSSQTRIKQLARNPLLLTIIALIHRYQATLPKERFKLYDKAVETLLTTWDSNKELSNHEILEHLELDDLRRLMERLAYWIHCQGGTGDTEGGTLIDREELIFQLTQYIREMKKVARHEAKAEAKRFLELIVRDRAGLLSLQGRDRYAFVHKTFQEYLAAMEIRDQQEDGFEVVIEHIEQYLHDAHWEEVLLLLIAQQRRKNPTKVLKFVLGRNSLYEQWLHRDLLFAAKCLSEDITINDDELLNKVFENLSSLAFLNRNRIGQTVQKKLIKVMFDFHETSHAKALLTFLKKDKRAYGLALLKYRAYLGEWQQVLSETLARLEEFCNSDSYSQERRWEESGPIHTALLELDNLSISTSTIQLIVKKIIVLIVQEKLPAKRFYDFLTKYHNTSSETICQLILSTDCQDQDINAVTMHLVGLIVTSKDKSYEEILEVLEKYLQHNDDNLKITAVTAIKRMQGDVRESSDVLLQLLKSTEDSIRADALWAFRVFIDEEPSIRSKIVEMNNDSNQRVRFLLASSLSCSSKLTDDEVSILFSMMEDSDSSVQWRAAATLVSHGYKNDETITAKLLRLSYCELPDKDDPHHVKYWAAMELGEVDHSPQLVATRLMCLLSDEYTSSEASGSLQKIVRRTNFISSAKIVQWVEDPQNYELVGNGIDVLWALLT